jgi:hypothetical protein
VRVEDPNALRFILQDDIYLLEEDKRYDNHIPKPQPEIETPPLNFNYLGANKKNFLILVNYPEHEFIAADHLTALESVLGRKDHIRDDVAIFNTAKNIAEYTSLTTYFKPQTLLILGKESVPAGIKEPRFNLFEKQDGLNVLYTFSFNEMMTSTDNKKAFWDQMKTL